MTKFDLIEELQTLPDDAELLCLGVPNDGDLDYFPVGGVQPLLGNRYFIHGKDAEEEDT